MTETNCPYMDKPCPKVVEVEEKVDRMYETQGRMVRIMYYIAGIVSITFGVSII